MTDFPPRRSAHRALAVAAAIAVALACETASAQAPPSADEVAVQRYGDGRRLLEAGDYAGALAELRASFEALPSPNTELLIGHAQRLGGQRSEAAATYQHVIAAAGEKVRQGEARFQATLEEAGRWAATLRASLAEVEVLVVGAPDGTTLQIDDRPVEAAPGPRGLLARSMREPGPIVVTATSPDGRTVSGSGEGAPGKLLQLDLDLTPPAAAPPPPPPPAPVVHEGVELPPPPVWIAAGVGVAGLAAFGIFGAMSAGAASDLDACSPGCDASFRDTADGGRTDQTIANVGLVVGAVGMVAAGVLWLTWPRDEPRAPGATGSTAGLRLRVSPAGAADATLAF